ncbi:MAG TPA: hypothetical protein VF422_09980 [Dokdonella sp.]
MICGAGKGSWEMRGIQLGAAMGARVTSSPTDEDFRWCDLVILVKKHAPTFAPRAHKHGKPIVWDALDFWSQPAHNSYNEAAAKNALQAQIRFIKPALTIGATQAMTSAIESFGYKGAYLPHHSWAGLAPTPPREHVSVVAYEGNPAYLGRWHGWISEACRKRGWEFAVNPPDLSKADILVAFRDGPWDGWICREWKSGVKVVNAIAAGRPLISQGSAAVRELQPVGAVIDMPTVLDDELDYFASPSNRILPAQCGRDQAPLYTLEAVAARYIDILSTVEAPCTA